MDTRYLNSTEYLHTDPDSVQYDANGGPPVNLVPRKHSIVRPMLARGRMVGRFCKCWANTGYWLHDQLILPLLGQCWPNGGLPTKTQVA